jgi:hypothetical protein
MALIAQGMVAKKWQQQHQRRDATLVNTLCVVNVVDSRFLHDAFNGRDGISLRHISTKAIVTTCANCEASGIVSNTISLPYIASCIAI